MKGSTIVLSLFFVLAILSPCGAVDLILNGVTQTLGGNKTYGRVSLTNSKIIVPKFNGNDYSATGILMIYADSFDMDATSTIDARGAGYLTALCSDGVGDANTGGAGGCSVIDSGGGGANVGSGGQGTKDCALPASNPHCQFPQEWEEDCAGAPKASGGSCISTANCRNNDGEPRTNGRSFRSSAFDPRQGMGGSGGDKGCRDGDGFSSGKMVGGSGGGRVKIIVSGTMNIRGKITVSGYRGCGDGNDSGGGGAGGTILLVANELNVYNSTTKLDATGGRGGDSQPKGPTETECAGTQTSGTCDDCGGGGGGGLIYILAPAGNYRTMIGVYNVSGAYGGACIGCENEARGIDGLVQYGHEGEICDGVDNTYDGEVDEGFPMLPCGIPSCSNGIEQTCPDGPTDDTSSTVASSTERATGRTASSTRAPDSTTTASSDSTGSANPTDSTGTPATSASQMTATATQLNTLSQSQTVVITATQTDKGNTNTGSVNPTNPSSTAVTVDIAESTGSLLAPLAVAIGIVALAL